MIKEQFMSNQDNATTMDIIHDQKAQRFETTLDGQTGYISYQEQGDTLTYDHTIVPQALGGRGIGSALVKHALDYAQEHNKKVIPQCSFVAAYINKHDEYQALV